MNLQRLLLRAMLFTLAIAAAAGVIAIFLSTNTMGRVAGTALVAAVCIGLGIPVSRLMDAEKSRPGGVLGLGVIVLSFLLFLGSIWAHAFVFGRSTEGELLFTGLAVLIPGLLAAFIVPHFKTPGLRSAAKVAVAMDLLAVAMLIPAIWIRTSQFQELFGESGGHIAGAGLAMAMCLVGMGIRMRFWQWAGVAAALAQLAMGLLGTWVLPSDDPTWYVLATSLGIVVGHANIITRVPVGASGIWAQLAAIGGLAATGVSTTILSSVTGGFDRTGPEMLTRITGASGLVAACGTMAVLVLYRLNRRAPGTVESVGAVKAVQLLCPHCGKKQSMPVGESACPACGLLITVKVREPRCGKCDYLLLGIKTGTCPECGSPIGGVISAT